PLAAAAIALVSFINYLGVRLAGRLQVVLTCIKVGAILAVVVLGFLFAGKRPPSAQPILPPSLNLGVLTGFLTAMVGALWARDGLFFRVADGIHPCFRTPSGAIVFQAVLACIMVLTGQFEDLFSLFIFAQWIFYALAVASVFGLRRREPDLPRPYRAWGYPVVPGIFVAGGLALIGNLWMARPGRSSIGLVLILAGLPVYRYWQRRTARKEARQPGVV